MPFKIHVIIRYLQRVPIQVINTRQNRNSSNILTLYPTRTVQVKKSQAGLGGGLLGNGLGVFGGVGAPLMLRCALFWGLV